MPSPMKTQHAPTKGALAAARHLEHVEQPAAFYGVEGLARVIDEATGCPQLLAITQRWLAWTQNGVQPIAVRIQLEADTRAAIAKATGGNA